MHTGVHFPRAHCVLKYLKCLIIIIIAGQLRMPIDSTRINDALRKLIKKNDLPKVVFHRLSNSSICI